MKTAKILRYNGAPTLFVDGKPHSAFAYMSFNLQEKYVSDFAGAGIDLFSFSVSPDYDYLRLSNDGWQAPDRFSYDDFDARMQMILRACPRANVFPRLYLCTPPWWDREHPDQLMQGVDGVYDPVPDFGFLPREVDESDLGFAKMTVPSFSSRAWQDFSGSALRQFLKYAEGKYGDSIIGYLICSGGTQEWYYWGAFEDVFPDVSAPQQAAFRTWLAGRGVQSPDENPIPPLDVRMGSEYGVFRDPSSEAGRMAAEYWKFHASAIESTMGLFCREAREIIGPDKVLGVFYGYFVDLQRQAHCWHNSGHLAFRQMSLDPNIDFVTSPTSYKDRRMGGFSIFNSLTESLAHHNKLWWDENDILTPLASECKGDLFYMPKSSEESRHIELREFANVLCHGSSMWWFDMFAGWFDDPQTMSDISTMARAASRALHADRSDTAELAVVLDDDSICHTECSNRLTVPLVTDQLMELGHAGVPFAMIHVDDIADMRQYKAYLFLDVFHVSDERRDKILSCIRESGVTAIFVFAAGIVKDEISIENMEALTGLKLSVDLAGRPIRVRTMGAAGIPAITYGPDAELSPMIFSVDSDAELLGTLEGMPRPGLVRKRIDRATSVFSSAPCIPADVLRELLKQGGCRVLTQGGEAVYANAPFLSVFGLPGETIRLDAPDVCLYELFSETEYRPAGGRFELPATETGAWVFFRGTRAQWLGLDGDGDE